MSRRFNYENTRNTKNLDKVTVDVDLSNYNKPIQVSNLNSQSINCSGDLTATSSTLYKSIIRNSLSFRKKEQKCDLFIQDNLFCFNEKLKFGFNDTPSIQLNNSIIKLESNNLVLESTQGINFNISDNINFNFNGSKNISISKNKIEFFKSHIKEDNGNLKFNVEDNNFIELNGPVKINHKILNTSNILFDNDESHTLNVTSSFLVIDIAEGLNITINKIDEELNSDGLILEILVNLESGASLIFEPDSSINNGAIKSDLTINENNNNFVYSLIKYNEQWYFKK